MDNNDRIVTRAVADKDIPAIVEFLPQYETEVFLYGILGIIYPCG